MQLRVIIANIIAATAILSILFLAYLTFGVMQEAQLSQTMFVLNTICNRAIQFDRIGTIVDPTYHDNAISIPRALLDDPSQIDCEGGIVAKPSDPRKLYSAVAILESSSPLNFYCIYNGPPPDFSSVFKEDAQPLKVFGYYDQSHRYVSANNSNTNDFKTSYKELIGSKHAEWLSKRCENFSFTKIQTKQKISSQSDTLSNIEIHFS